jgi:uroporphyrin-III C-methyltransferase/precorrin-2 dehydrogenase/sirohydrochlorin ferrochelatase
MLLPLFLNIAGRRVVLVGGGPVAAAKLQQLIAAGAQVCLVSPHVVDEIEEIARTRAQGPQADVEIVSREFAPSDLDGAWLAVAAATPEVNRSVAAAAEERRVFVNAVDDPANASAYLSGVVRRDTFTLAISTSGEAPGLTALLRQGLDELLPRGDLAQWLREARRQREHWKAEGVPMEQRRPLLLAAINRLYEGPQGLRAQGSGTESPQPSALSPDVRPASPDVRPASPDVRGPVSPAVGHVSLVGAGPGDPALLTRKAIARLRAADLVLYDALIDERVLRYARHAQRFFVGKRAGRQALTQEKINALMIRAARRGRLVVRLKGGDPFVLGRGGEEALALAAAGVAHDVVPGITSAIAAPALAGIPVTHRGIASAFLVVSGHDEQAFAAATGSLTPNGVTLVVLMGIARSAALAGQLIDRGWKPETPSAVVVDASLPGQQAWRGRLDEMAANRSVLPPGPNTLGTIIIGEVVSVADAAFFSAGTTDTVRTSQSTERAYVSRR